MVLTVGQNVKECDESSYFHALVSFCDCIRNVRGLNLKSLVNEDWVAWAKWSTCLKARLGGWWGLGVWNGVRQIHTCRVQTGGHLEQGCKPLLMLAHNLALASWPIGPYFRQISHRSPWAPKWLRTERIGPHNTEYIDWSVLWPPFVRRSLPTFQQ